MPVIGPFYQAYLDPKEASQIPHVIGSICAAAKETLDVAIYDIWHNYSPKNDALRKAQGLTENFDFDVINGIICAVNRGVNVRLVVDYNNAALINNSKGTNFLTTLMGLSQAKSNFTIVRRAAQAQTNAHMHNKYIIVDNNCVWTGSYNWTTTAFIVDSQINNGILLIGKGIADAFSSDFNAMFNKVKGSGTTTPNRFLKYKDGSIKIGFSPTDNITQLIISHLKTATKSINLALFEFTDDEVKDILIEKAKQGVIVRLLGSGSTIYKDDRKSDFEKYNQPIPLQDKLIDVTKGRVFQELNQKSNVEVRTWTKNLMHLKSYSVDNKYFGIGSFNISRAALITNDENHVVIEDSRLTSEFNEVFDRIWDTETKAIDKSLPLG